MKCPSPLFNMFKNHVRHCLNKYLRPREDEKTHGNSALSLRLVCFAIGIGSDSVRQ